MFIQTEFFSYIVRQPPVALPGTTPIYSDDAFRILGYIVERITGKSFESVLNQRILEPLELRRTSPASPENPLPGVVLADMNNHEWAMQDAA